MYSSGAKSLSSQIRRTTLRLERDVCALEKRLVAVSHHPGRPEVLGQRSDVKSHNHPVLATLGKAGSGADLARYVSTPDYAQEYCEDSWANCGLQSIFLALTNALSNYRPKIRLKTVYLLKQRHKRRRKVLIQNLTIYKISIMMF